jgi:energy-coupling factor transporter ATP-binding protein EcfA2
MVPKFHIKNGCNIQIVGPSGSGKTYFTCSLLAHPTIFQVPIRQIYWHSGVPEKELGPTLDQLNKLKSVHHEIGLPEGWTSKPQQYDVIVIDDLFEEVNRDSITFNALFTKVARHREVTVIFLTQNLFHQGGQHRTRNLNAHYLIIFKNPRDQTVIDYVARQAFPNNRKDLIDAFNDATANKPHGYLFIDFTQDCRDNSRVMTDVLNKKKGPYTYILYKQ